ncbi:MAG TPA: Gfo/Idh/MocA family oxidoreductase [Thermomicrobiales bacterium]|nr:Gfo/Idh/MocA family oxidoreductase [Thermomicrobiales bacterium]
MNSPAQRSLRIGILGSGNIARHHARGWSTYPDRAEIVGFADIATARAQQMSNTYTGGSAIAFTSGNEMLAEADLDVVDICLPHHLHTDAIIAAAEAGKAILCEKPLCTTLDDATRIRDVIQKTRVTFMGAHNQLFQPSLLEARRLMAGGFLGTPYLLRSIETFQARKWEPFGKAETDQRDWGWRSDIAQAGGGELIDTGYHGTYRLLTLADSRPVEVTAILSKFFQKGLATEDTAMVIVRFESGAVGEILTSWALDVVGNKHFEVQGELGALSGGPGSLEHQLYGWADSATKTFEPVHSFTLEIEHFIEVVTGEAANPADIDETARTLQVIKAAYLSADLGRTVQLPEDPTAPATADGHAASTPTNVPVLDAAKA